MEIDIRTLMGFLPFLHFFCLLVCAYLAIFVLYKDPKSLLNRAGSVLMTCFALWNFGDIFLQNPDSTITKEMVAILQNISSIGWIGFASAILCFSLAFSKREKLLKKKWFLFFVFILPLFFIYKQWTNCLTINPIRLSYGWSYVWADTIWTYLFYIFYFLFSLASIYFIYFYGRKTKKIIEKKQANIISFSVFASLIVGTIFDVVIPNLGIYSIPNLANIFVFILAVGLFYAIIKYKFLTITPATAAENIISSMDELLILLNLEGNILNVNNATSQTLQYDQKELEGKSVTILFQDDNLNINLLEKITKEEGIKSHESSFLTKNGKKVPIIFSSSPMKDEEGIIIGTVFIARDITERIKAEEEIALLAHAVKSINECISITDMNNNILFVNQCFLDTYGYSHDELIGQHISIVISPNNPPEVVQGVLPSALHGGWHGELLNRKKDGSEFLISLSTSVVNNQYGNTISLIGVATNITERKQLEVKTRNLLKMSERSRKDLLSILEDQMQAQEALKDSSKKWQTTFDGMRDSVFLLDTNGMILQTNKISQQILGKKEKEIVGHYCYEVMHNTPSCIDGCPLVRMRQTNQRETMVLSTDGKWFEIIVDPILDDDNKLTGAVHLICDITERMEVQEKLRKFNEELEQRVIDRTVQLEASNKELEAFSYSVSHDLRAPLRHISGYVDMLNRHFHDSLPGKGKHYLDTIADSAHQMGVLIDDLLQFSRTGRQEMQQLDLDMNAVLQEALKIIQQELSGRSIEWVITELPHVNGDHNLLRLVWINLLSNAVKFTQGKKKARIETGFREEKKEHLFFIRDNGVGFDMQYADKLFGVFQRLHSTKDFEGTGIGLANVRRIILKHGGRTWAEGELDKGATFYFTLPKQAIGNR